MGLGQFYIYKRELTNQRSPYFRDKVVQNRALL